MEPRPDCVGPGDGELVGSELLLVLVGVVHGAGLGGRGVGR